MSANKVVRDTVRGLNRVFCEYISILACDICIVTALLNVSNHPLNDILVYTIRFVRCSVSRLCFKRVLVGLFYFVGYVVTTPFDIKACCVRYAVANRIPQKSATRAVFGMPYLSMVTMLARTSALHYGLDVRCSNFLYVFFARSSAKGPAVVTNDAFSAKT